VFSIQSAKESLKGMTDLDFEQLRGQMLPDCGRLRRKYEEQKSNLCSVVKVTLGLLSLFGVRVKWSVLRQVHSFFQTEFSKECDPELPPSTSSIFFLP
jgi:hypothetical protein